MITSLLTTLGFTLVELLAVIVILSIILVIAVPRVMSTIEDAKKGTLESSAMMIASVAEKAKVQNTLLGNTEEITCDGVTNINKSDYEYCSITFDDKGNAEVTIKGKGNFANLYVCNATKVNAEATNENCNNIQVNYPLFLSGEELTVDKFEVIVTDSDGSTRILENGTRFAVDDTIESTTIILPNWPENYANNIDQSETYWEISYEGADAIQITFDDTSKMGSGDYVYI